MNKGALYNFGVIVIVAFSSALAALVTGFIYGLPLWGAFALLKWLLPALPKIGYFASVVIAALITFIKSFPTAKFGEFKNEKIKK